MTTPLAVALGDPAGIGPEITAKAWERREEERLSPFFAIGAPEAVASVWNGPIEIVSGPDEAAACFATALPLLRVDGGGECTPGRPTLEGARSALDSLEIAVGLTRSGAASGLVTGPVSKAQLYAIGFVHPGQTEFVAERCGIASTMVAMMLAGPTLRTVPVTTHVALRDVPDLLTTDLIVNRGRTTIRGLRRQFGIERPRIAVAGLNPHAGENGALGREEIDIVIPAIERLREENEADIVGPLAADTMFHLRMRATYDAALCLYHDQALVPLKTLHFDEGVNITLGLPIVRTSPDHGTAFAIAGQNRAEPGAMIAALSMAAACAQRMSKCDMPLADLPPLREVIARHGLSASKALGQNFLLDEQLLDRIARIPGDLTGRRAYEVGPGPGGLTRALLRAGAEVVAVERDRRCLPALAEIDEASGGRLRVIEGDALAIDEAAEAGTGAHIVANLPYNVGTALLVRWLGGEPWPPFWASLTLMFQQEVAERIAARPGSSAYGRLAVLAQWRSDARVAMKVHRSAFVPPPKVMSAVVHITPKAAPEGVRAATLEALTGAAFGQRRKMLRQSLKGLPGALDALASVGIDSERRAETLSVDEFVAVARALTASA